MVDRLHSPAGARSFRQKENQDWKAALLRHHYLCDTTRNKGSQDDEDCTGQHQRDESRKSKQQSGSWKQVSGLKHSEN